MDKWMLKTASFWKWNIFFPKTRRWKNKQGSWPDARDSGCGDQRPSGRSQEQGRRRSWHDCRTSFAKRYSLPTQALLLPRACRPAGVRLQLPQVHSFFWSWPPPVARDRELRVLGFAWNLRKAAALTWFSIVFPGLSGFERLREFQVWWRGSFWALHNRLRYAENRHVSLQTLVNCWCWVKFDTFKPSGYSLVTEKLKFRHRR